MRHSLTVAAGVLLAVAAPAAADFAGTWKSDVAAAKLSTKPDVFALKDGVYSCSSCAPPYRIAADGKPHARAGQDYYDAVSVNSDSADSVTIMRYRKGVVTDTETATVSADGAMLTWVENTSDNANGAPMTFTFRAKRVGPAPAGAHAVSGSWLNQVEGAQIPDGNLFADISLAGDTVTMSWRTGEHYAAKLGGPRVPVVGDKAGATVAVVAATGGFKETQYVGGKATSVATFALADPSTITIRVLDVKSGRSSDYVMRKQ